MIKLILLYVYICDNAVQCKKQVQIQILLFKNILFIDILALRDMLKNPCSNKFRHRRFCNFKSLSPIQSKRMKAYAAYYFSC